MNATTKLFSSEVILGLFIRLAQDLFGAGSVKVDWKEGSGYLVEVWSGAKTTPYQGLKGLVSWAADVLKAQELTEKERSWYVSYMAEVKQKIALIEQDEYSCSFCHDTMAVGSSQTLCEGCQRVLRAHPRSS